MNIKLWHIGVSLVVVIACFLILFSGSSGDHIGEHEPSIFGPEQHTVPIRFKRRKDIPNQCFPLTKTVNGCLPSVTVLGPSILELERVKEILESHPSLHSGNKQSEFHSDPRNNDFHEYFQSFPTDLGRMFTYYDAASSYFHSSEAALSIRSVAPTSVFVVPLMDPILRTISQYYGHSAKLPKSCFDVPIEDYLQQEIDLLQKCEIPIDIPKVPWNAKAVPQECQLISPKCKNFIWNEERNSFQLNTQGAFLSEGLYIHHFTHWFSYFDRKQFYVITTDAMEHPSPEMWAFMGVEPDLWLPEFIDASEPNNYKSAVSASTYKWLHNFFAPSVKALKKAMPHVSFPSF